MDFKFLPDTQSQTFQDTISGLAWVGMERIQMPIKWETQTLPALVDAKVNLLGGKSRGIHMSRLYTILSDNFPGENLSFELLEEIAQEFIKSQKGLSHSASVKVNFQLPLLRKALMSPLSGWRLYPVQMEILIFEGKVQRKLFTEILYSSTCPASTSLAADLWKQKLQQDFASSEKISLDDLTKWVDSFHGMPATPHAQRSLARVELTLAAGSKLKFDEQPGSTLNKFPKITNDIGPAELIEGLESVLQTPVQTAVKRIDEQEFARLNGQNPMFCEDAARKVQDWLESLNLVQGYHGIFEHQESLHAHNAVATIHKSP